MREEREILQKLCVLIVRDKKMVLKDDREQNKSERARLRSVI